MLSKSILKNPISKKSKKPSDIQKIWQPCGQGELLEKSWWASGRTKHNQTPHKNIRTMLGELIIISSKEGLEPDETNKKTIVVFSGYGTNLNSYKLQEQNGIGNKQPFGGVSMQLAKISENLTTLQGTTVTYPTKKREVWKTSSIQKGWLGWIWWYDTKIQEGPRVTRSLIKKTQPKKHEPLVVFFGGILAII